MTEVSVQDALAKGRADVILPAIVSIYVTIFLLLLLMAFGPLSFFTVVFMTPIVLVVAAVIHSRNMIPWKIWAFEHVRNVHQLKKMAEHQGIIIAWLESLISLPREKQLILERLALKFQQPDQFPTDESIAQVVETHYNKRYNLIESSLYFGAVCITTGALVLAAGADEAIFLAVCVPWLFFAVMVIYNLNQYLSTQPPLVFSSEGIKVRSVFIHKSRISDIKVNLNRRISQVCVSVHGSWNDVVVGIYDLDTTPQKLSGTLEVFKRRWKTGEQAPTEHREKEPGRYLK